MTFGERLKSVREKMGLTQMEISEKLGIPRTTYSGYEYSGKREPDFKTLCLISDFLGVSLDYLIKGEGHKHQDNSFIVSQLNRRIKELEKEFEGIAGLISERKKEIQDMKKLL